METPHSPRSLPLTGGHAELSDEDPEMDEEVTVPAVCRRHQHLKAIVSQLLTECEEKCMIP
jgi:hypothetical protein